MLIANRKLLAAAYHNNAMQLLIPPLLNHLKRYLLNVLTIYTCKKFAKFHNICKIICKRHRIIGKIPLNMLRFCNNKIEKQQKIKLVFRYLTRSWQTCSFYWFSGTYQLHTVYAHQTYRQTDSYTSCDHIAFL